MVLSDTYRCFMSCGSEKDMIGMPAGVKFDPSDQELIHHLQTMVGDGGSRAHPLIDEFIPTIQGEDGICYTHPENLPGDNALITHVLCSCIRPVVYLYHHLCYIYIYTNKFSSI
jgi:hypothetical protein